jgi:signal transduction histidine kinase/ligand-binding sensor domain-containing protein/CheY-like chemotaxis protein
MKRHYDDNKGSTKETVKRCLVALALTASLLLLQGQTAAPAYKFINLGAAQKLSDLSVGGLYQDRYGFVWATTNFGLNRYDGHEFTAFLAVPGDSATLSSSNLSGCNPYEDHTGNLWIATSVGGLNQYDYATGKFRQYKADANRADWLSSNQLSCVVGDGAKGLWIATLGQGLCYYDFESGTFQAYVAHENSPESLMGDNTIPTLMRDSRGRLWLGTTRGVSIFDGQDFARYHPDARQPRSLSSAFTVGLLEDRSGRIWIGTENGLNLWNEGQKDFTHFFPSQHLDSDDKHYDFIWEILEDSEGILWLGTNAGLVRFDPAREQFAQYVHNPSDPYSILPGPVHALMEDREKNLWIGIHQGISILNKASARFNRPEVQPLQAAFGQIALAAGIVACLETQDKLWLATQKGLYTCQYHEAPQLLLTGDFTALFQDSKGVVYAGTVNQGFYRIFPDGKIIHTETFACHDPVNIHSKPARINGFTQDRKGRILVGMLGGLLYFDADLSKCRKYFFSNSEPNSISSNEIRALLTDASDNLWITTNDGMNKLAASELAKPWGASLHFERLHYQDGNANSLSSNAAFPIIEDRRRNIWVGTDVGLNRYEPSSGKWTRFYTADGLPQNRITNILEDQKGRIWITAYDGGLACFDPDSERFRSFFLEDGLNSRAYEWFNALVSSSGLILLAGMQGVNFFDPEEVLREPSLQPAFRFTSFQIFNREAPISSGAGMLPQPIFMAPEIVLNHTHRVFSVEFSAFNFIHSGKESYRYRLVNFADDWIYIGNERKITFSNLPPGRYVLEVEWSDNKKDWLNPGASLQIHLLPPWYWAWWSKTLYALLFIGASFLFYRFQLNRRLANERARLAEARAQLEQERAAQLQELHRAKSDFYTNITHEFRTPLTAILGMAEQVAQSPARWLGEGTDIIKRNGRILLRLVNQMLDLARLEAGALPVRMQQSDIIAWLRTIIELFRTLADDGAVALRFEPQQQSLLMDFDPDKISSILGNLLSNAIKFTPPGGSVTVYCRLPTADCPLPTVRCLLLTIQDTGPGIPPGQLPHVFERFYQADDTATRRGEGTGIGLALTRELVKLLGGAIAAESVLGQGSVFRVWLPISRQAPLKELIVEEELAPPTAPRRQAAPLAAVPGRRPLALIVEDNPDVATLLQTCLQYRYKLRLARDGKEGLDLALKLQPDVIISDVMMPVMDGFELCRTLKEDQRTSHIPIVLLTARADLESRLEGLEMGADAYLAKPFNQQELELSLRKSLELRERLRERYAGGKWPRTPAASGAFRQEDAFVQQLHGLLEQNHSLEGFNVNALAGLLFMTEKQLRYKTKALLGELPKDLLSTYRLEKAYALLRQGDRSVSEVAFATGFKEVAHFSNAFYKAYGVRPSEVR